MKCVLHCVVSWSIDSDSPSYRRILTMATPSDRAILNSIINPLLPVGEFESSVDDAENEGTKPRKIRVLSVSESHLLPHVCLQMPLPVKVLPKPEI